MINIRFRYRWYIGLLFCLFALQVAGAEPLSDSTGSQWTRFRGPNGSGISSAKGLPTIWTDQDYLWRTTLPGAGHSSPVIWKDKVFVTCGEAANARRIVLCLQVSDGSVLWQHDYDSKTFKMNRDNSYASSTPAVDSQHVYLYWTTPEEVTVLALTHQGQEAWRQRLGPFISQHGSGTSPIVAEDLVIVNNDQEGPSSIMALDAKTGAIRWKLPRRTNRVAYSTPCLRTSEQDSIELIFTSSGHGFSGVDLKTGQLNWELPKAFPFRVVGSAALGSELMVATCGEGGVGRGLVAARPGSSGLEPKILYEMKEHISYVPTPIIKEGLLFLWGDNGSVACHRAETGQLLWRERIKDSFYASPIWINGAIYGLSKTGVVYVLAASEQYKLISSVPLGEPSFATPAVSDGVLYWRTATRVLALGGQLKNDASK